MNKFKLLFLSTIVVMTGCSTTNKANLVEQNQQIRDYIASEQIQNVDKITSFRFHGWNDLTDDFILISSSPKRQYLVELSGFCADIRWAQTIVINRSNSSTLYAKFDTIAPASSPQMNCRINTIYPLSSEQEAAIKAIHNPPEQDD